VDEKQAVAEVRKKYKGDEENAIVAAVRDRFREVDRLKNESQQAAGEKAWAIYAETRDIDAIPLTTLQAMDGKERTILEDKAKNDTKGTDYANGGPDYYKLKLMARDDPVRFKQENPFAYKLSETDRKEIIKLQTDEQKINYFGSDVSLVDQGAADAGLNPKDKLKDNWSGREVRAFYERIRQEQEQYMQLNGKSPDEKAIKDIVDRLTIKIIKDRKPLFDWMNPDFLPAWLTDPVIPIWPRTDKITGTTEIEGVPSGMIDELARALQESGTPVTEENIQQLYQYVR